MSNNRSSTRSSISQHHTTKPSKSQKQNSIHSTSPKSPALPPPLAKQRRPGNGPASPYSGGGHSRHPEDAGDFFSTAFYTRMREQATSGGAGMGGRYRPAGAGGVGARNNAGPFDGVRINLFDIFRFSPGNTENLGVPKARWRNILVKLEVSLEELLSGVVKEVDVSPGFGEVVAVSSQRRCVCFDAGGNRRNVGAPKHQKMINNVYTSTL